MEPFKDDNDLTAELRALRPEPRPEFTAELDERAAAGFPRRSPHSSGPLAGLFARLRALPPRRLALSAGAAALAAVAAATVVVAVGEPTDRLGLAGPPQPQGGLLVRFRVTARGKRRGQFGWSLRPDWRAPFDRKELRLRKQWRSVRSGDPEHRRHGSPQQQQQRQRYRQY